MLQNNLYTSHDSFDFGDKNFKYDPFCNDDDDKLKILDIKLHKSVNLDDSQYQPSRSISDSEKLQYKTRSTKFQTSNKTLDLFALSDTDTVYDSRPSFNNQSNFCLHFN